MRSFLIRFGMMAVLLAAQATAHAAGNVACLLSCFKQHACAVKTPALLQLNGDNFVRWESCNTAQVESGSVLVRYRSGGAWFSPTEAPGPGASLGAIFDKNRPDQPCSVPTTDCLQARMSTKVAATAGHGIDGQQAAPGGTGQPCRRGLPCGLVLAPQGTWQFKLDEAIDGQWQVRLLRGEARPGSPREWSAPVTAGVVKADGQLFEAGRVYAYSLVDRSRAVIATGEFETVGAKRIEILQRLAQRRVSEGMSERAAWIDTLLNAELEWDALHAVSGN